MQWNSFSDFISMGGYGAFVWGSFGVAFVLLTAEILMLRARKRRIARTATLSDELESENSKLETIL